MTVVVVEGPEGSGKSTFARAFAERHKLTYFHTGGSTEPAEDWIPRIAQFTNIRNVVFDRFPSISERVYAKVMGRTQRVSTDWLMGLWEGLRDPRLIYCRPPTGVMRAVRRDYITKAHKSAEEEAAAWARHDQLVAEYDVVMLQFRHERYDWSAE